MSVAFCCEFAYENYANVSIFWTEMETKKKRCSQNKLYRLVITTPMHYVDEGTARNYIGIFRNILIHQIDITKYSSI